MTSEVVVMNRLAVAMAADSAVTAAGQKKVHNSANKLFMLSKAHPVGVMVYNNASLMSLPWETLIKEFRLRLGDQEFDRLEEYGDRFIEFVRQQGRTFGPAAEKNYFLSLLELYFDQIVADIRAKLDQAQSVFADPAANKEAERGRIYRETIDYYVGRWASLPPSDSVPAGTGLQMVTECSPEMAQLVTERFKVPNPKLGNTEVQALRQLAIDLVEKEKVAPESLTGVVVAGFGKLDFYPVLQVFEVGEVYAGHLKLTCVPVQRISEDKSTHVQAFADSDTAHAFLNGIPADFEHQIIRWAYQAAEKLTHAAVEKARGMTAANRADLSALLDGERDTLLMEFADKIEAYKEANYVWQAEDAILNLPKDELAQVAAALVNINLLKKRMSMSLETVGGPVDVAVISKGDGFIWIDRKHYFSASKNPQFLRNRFGTTPIASAESTDA